MKFSLIAAVVLLALAQGSFAEDVTFEGLSHFIEEMKAKLNSQDLATQYQAAIEDNKEKLEPLTEVVKSAATNLNEQMGPHFEQLQHTFANFEMQFKSVLEKIKETAKSSQQ